MLFSPCELNVDQNEEKSNTKYGIRGCRVFNQEGTKLESQTYAKLILNFSFLSGFFF